MLAVMFLPAVAACQAGEPAETRPADASDGRASSRGSQEPSAGAPQGASLLEGTGSESWTQYRGDLENTGQVRSSRLPALRGLKWRYLTGGPVTSSPVAADDMVIVGSEDGFLYAIHAADGRLRWKARASTKVDHGISFSTPCLDGDAVFVGSRDGRLYKFRRATGEPLWTFETGGEIYGSPKVKDGVVYVGSTDRNFYAVRASDGGEIWRKVTTNVVGSTPALAGDMVIFPSRDKHLYVLNASDGTEIFKVRVYGASVAAPTLGAGFAFLLVEGRRFQAVDLVSRTIRWEVDATADSKSGAAFDGRQVIVGIGMYAMAFEAVSGRELWSFAAERARVSSSPAVQGDRVYVTSADHRLYVLDRKTGQKVWSYETEGECFSSPCVVNGSIYFGSSDNFLYAVH